MPVGLFPCGGTHKPDSMLMLTFFFFRADGRALWTLPEYRNRGTGSLVLKWFTERVDELRVEAYLEGTAVGTPLYEEFGFVTIEHTKFRFRRDGPSEEWMRMVRELQSRPISIMWRPINAVYEEGKTALPWEGKPRAAKL